MGSFAVFAVLGLVLSVCTSQVTSGDFLQALCASSQQGAGTLCNATSTPTPDLSSPTFNSTDVACLQGVASNIYHYDFLLDCKPLGLISVERIFHGMTPRSLGCSSSAPKEKCCPGYDHERDCVFATDEGLEDLRETCDGFADCSPKLSRATVVNGSCPDRQNGSLTYDDYSTFAFVQYSCINRGLLTDVCDAGTTTRNKEVYLETNVYHSNRDQATCSCVVTTACNHRLLFYPIILDLASDENTDSAATSGEDTDCVEDVRLVDVGNSSKQVNVNCNDNEFDDELKLTGAALFESQTNIVSFQLLLHSFNLGKMMFKVVATDDAVVDVRCGRTTELPVWDPHQCPSAATTTSSFTAEMAPVNATNTTASNDDSGGGVPEREIAIAVSTAVVAFIVILAFIIIVVVICRTKKNQSQQESDYDEMDVHYDNFRGAVQADHDPETPYQTVRGPYDHPVRPPLPNRGSVDDSDEKQPYEDLTYVDSGFGATGGAAARGHDNPVYYENEYGYDNDLNESKAEGGAKKSEYTNL